MKDGTVIEMCELTIKDLEDLAEHSRKYNVMRTHVKNLQNSAYCLSALAESFYRVGNRDIANELTYESERILEAVKGFEDYVSDSIDDAVHQTNQSTYNMMNGIFAGMKIGRDAQRMEDEKK